MADSRGVCTFDRTMKYLGFMLFLFAAHTGLAQHQLVAVKNGHVITFWREGDDIVLTDRKGREQSGTITRINEFYLLIRTDSIPFNQIARIDCKGRLSAGLLHNVGDVLFKAGIGYFVLQQANEILIQHNGFDSDPSVWKPALAGAVTGFVLRSIKPRYLRPGNKLRLKQATYGSLLYQRK